jgi:hypothetical protein
MESVELKASFLFNSQEQPFVYVWRRGEEVLYVGSSGNLFAGLSRHNVIGAVEPVQERDVIELRRYEDAPSMLAAEDYLIKMHHPGYNVAGSSHTSQDGDTGVRTCLKCQAKFKPTRKWQRYCSKRCRSQTWFNRVYVKRAADEARIPISISQGNEFKPESNAGTEVAEHNQPEMPKPVSASLPQVSPARSSGQSIPSAETLQKRQAILAKHKTAMATTPSPNQPQASKAPAPVVNILEDLWAAK